jgi:hypothetical protein
LNQKFEPFLIMSEWARICGKDQLSFLIYLLKVVVIEAKSSTDLKGKEEWERPSRNIELKQAQEGTGAPFSNETKVNGPGTLHHRVAVLELGWKQGAAL